MSGETTLPKEQIKLIVKSLAKDPKDRYGSADELLLALEKFSSTKIDPLCSSATKKLSVYLNL